ncbi:MAG: thiamine diphosphokinase [Rhodobacteraceae bacterium]|nr:thiamine diphosphokinase [Paracoccaceae bacterium]
MTAPIVQISQPVTLIGGGWLGRNDLRLALERAPYLVAADSGAARALAAGHVPKAVIGDFDSLAAGERARIPHGDLFAIREQDSTDFDKALRNIAAPVVLGVGFLGGRADHQLAAFNTLVRRADRPCVLLGPREVVFHAPARMQVALRPGDVVSLFPMRRVSGRSSGLQWPIDGLDLAPDGRIGTSNRALGPMTLETDGPGLLVMLPRRALDGAMRAIAPDRGAP